MITRILKRYANFVRVGSDGNVGMYYPDGTQAFSIQESSNIKPWININNINGMIYGIGTGGTGVNALITNVINSGNWFLNSRPNDIAIRNTIGRVLIGTTGNYGNVIDTTNGGAMNGLQQISGSPDLRIGVTAADASAITIFSSTKSGVRYEVKARILATAGTSATYTITWTEGGAARTVALTVSALGTEYHDNFVIAPDSGTNITAQITSLTSSTVNVDAIVSVLG